MLLRALVATFLLAALTPAQWIHYPVPGTPRTRDGKPNLNARAPRLAGHPNLSGIWNAAGPLPCDGINRVCGDLPVTPQFFNFAVDLKEPLPYQPSSIARMKSINPVSGDPYTRCIVPGGPRMFLLPTTRKIVQNPALIVILDEFNTHYRQIFLDGRPLPVDPQPVWNGYSIGKWEGETLVVHSLGYRDDQTLDNRGSPLTSAARVTERFRRPSFGRLEIEVTVDDPVAYTRPFTVTIRQELAPDTDLIDTQCAENEKDIPHLPGK